MKTKTLLLAAILATSGIALADAGQPTKPVVHHKGSVKEKFYARLEGGLAIPGKVKTSFGDVKGKWLGVDKTVNGGSGKIKSKNSLVFGLGAGYIVNEFFRTDLMLGYKEYKYKTPLKPKVKTYSLMANGYLEAHNDTIFVPYLLAGVGIGSSKASLSGGSGKVAADDDSTWSFKGKKTTNFIWNLGAGVRAKVLESVDVDLTYKYVNLGNAKFNSTAASKVANSKEALTGSGKFKSIGGHEILAGIMFRF